MIENYSNIKIIVLTPVKNEDWILSEFLTCASLFADCIIVADQNSNDESLKICKRFSKVVVINNKDTTYSESERQKMLITKARELFPNDKRILFGLDADEIVSFDSIQMHKAWREIKLQPPGTTFFFEKPDILPGVSECVRWRTSYFPIGYVDDGILHNPKEIHSRRIPNNETGKNVQIDEIKFLHFAISRNRVQSAKMRYYSVIENVKKTSPVYIRRKVYKCYFDPYKYYPHSNFETIPTEWIDGWMAEKVNLRALPEPEFPWQDFEVLRFFDEYGCKKFYLDDIWDYDWNRILENAHQHGMFLNLNKITRPDVINQMLSLMVDLLNSLHKGWRKLIS